MRSVWPLAGSVNVIAFMAAVAIGAIGCRGEKSGTGDAGGQAGSSGHGSTGDAGGGGDKGGAGGTSGRSASNDGNSDGGLRSDTAGMVDGKQIGSDDDGGYSSDAAGPCDPKLPTVLMNSAAGSQPGVQESYCASMQWSSSEMCTVCADTRSMKPIQFTIAHPGDKITISMPEGALIEGERCVPSCPPQVAFYTYGCNYGVGFKEAIATLIVQEDQPWVIDLNAGIYVVDLFSNFESDDGVSGDTAVAFGLIVDPSRKRSIIEAASVDAGCEKWDGGGG